MTVPIEFFMHPEDRPPFHWMGSAEDVPGAHRNCLSDWQARHCRKVRDAQNLRDKVHVTATTKQYHKLFVSLCDVCEKIGLSSPPDLYVASDNSIKISSYGDNNPVIVVSTVLVANFTNEEIRAAFAHECGHVLFHHTAWLSLEDVFTKYFIPTLITFIGAGISLLKPCLGVVGVAAVGVAVSWIVQSRMRARFYRSKRICDFSADRIAAYVLDDPRAVVRMFVRLQGGDAKMLEALESQADDQIREAEDLRVVKPSFVARFLDWLGLTTLENEQAGKINMGERRCDLMKWFSEKRTKFPSLGKSICGHFKWLDK